MLQFQKLIQKAEKYTEKIINIVKKICNFKSFN